MGHDGAKVDLHETPASGTGLSEIALVNVSFKILQWDVRHDGSRCVCCACGTWIPLKYFEDFGRCYCRVP